MDPLYLVAASRAQRTSNDDRFWQQIELREARRHERRGARLARTRRALGTLRSLPR